MLQNIREKIQGIIATIIIVLVCSTFAFWGVQNYLQSHSNLETVAKVNNIKITQKQVHTNYERAKQQFIATLGKNYSYDSKAQEQIKNNVIQELIKTEAISQGLIKLGFNVANNRIVEVIKYLPEFQVNNHFSNEKFQRILNNAMLSPNDFFNELKISIMTKQLHNGLVMSSFILPEELTTAIKIFNQTRDIKYTIITSKHLKNNIKLNDQDIQSYYQQHQEEFQNSEQVSVSYIELFADKFKNQISITPNETQQYYKEHIDNYSSPKRWQIERLFVEIPTTNPSPKTINNAAEQIKSLIAKAKSGVAISTLDPEHNKAIWVSKNQLPPDVISAITILKPGEISAPIKTPTGFLAIKILQTQEASTQPFTKVQAQVIKALTQDKLTQLFSEQTNKLSDLTYTNSETLQPAATELGLQIKTTSLFTQEGEKTGLLANTKIIKTAFSEALLKQNYNSNVIELEPGHVLVMRINEYHPAALKPLTEVKSSVIQKLTANMEQQKVKELGKQLVENIKDNSNADAIIKQYGLSWEVLLNVKRQETSKFDSQLINAAFSIPPTNNKQPAIVGLTLANNNFAIIQLQKVNDGNIKNLNPKQLKEFENNIAKLSGEMDYHIYLKNLIDQAKIKRYDQK